jgi:amino-acid N-acetyltransferase
MSTTAAVDVFAKPALGAVRRLLADAGLPTSDLTGTQLETFFGAGTPDCPEGIVGVELHGDSALLRSLVVTPLARSRGLGRALVSAAERCARSAGASDIYLLTSTAEPFFTSLGYVRTDRSTAPPAIRRTHEFASLCPASASFMHKRLAPTGT